MTKQPAKATGDRRQSPAARFDTVDMRFDPVDRRIGGLDREVHLLVNRAVRGDTG